MYIVLVAHIVPQHSEGLKNGFGACRGTAVVLVSELKFIFSLL